MKQLRLSAPPYRPHLYAQQQQVVGVLQLPLSLLHLSDPLLLLLELADVVHRGLEDGALVPPHLPEGGQETVSSGSKYAHKQRWRWY